MYKVFKRMSNNERVYLSEHKTSIDYDHTADGVYTVSHYEERIVYTLNSSLIFHSKREAEAVARKLGAEVEDAQKRPD